MNASPLADALRAHPEVAWLEPVVAGDGAAVYLVGGAVRDLLLGAGQVDVDLVIEGDAVAFARRVAHGLGVRAVVHGAFGTAVVKGGGRLLDVATARSERYRSPAALPEVAPASLADDLARRDFAVNAMAASLRPGEWGMLIDPFDGRSDVATRTIRVLHPRSFTDDPTRLLRGVRLETRLGFRFDPETEALARADPRLVGLLSPARLRDALLLLLAERCAAIALARLGDLGVLAASADGLAVDDDLLGRADALVGHAPDADRRVCLLALCARAVEPGRLARRLRLTRRMADVLAACARADRLRSFDGAPAEAVICAAAIAPERAAAAVRFLEVDRHVRPLLDGADVMRELAIRSSPRVGDVLEALRRAKVAGELPDREAELAFVRALA